MKNRKLTLDEYTAWIKNPISRQASLPSFFGEGVKRTKRILKGVATPAEVAKWESFIKRHYAGYELHQTTRQRIAILNWGWFIPKATGEKFNLAKKWKEKYVL